MDAQEGLQWLERAMAAGNGLAFGRAARVYLNGTSTIPADPARADALFEEAIQRGQAQAFIDRGYARLNGQLPVDLTLPLHSATGFLRSCWSKGGC